jgi:CRP/FNR family transcriptional regulator, cyclic AMP receptor protein
MKMKLFDLVPGMRDTPVRRFRRGGTILYQGEVPRAAYVVKSGIVKVYNINNRGEEQISTFQMAGELFPTQWIFKVTSNALYYYEAMTDVELYAFSREELLDYIYSNSDVLRQTMEHYLLNYTHVLQRINALEQTRAADKIMFTLYSLMVRFGEETDPGLYTINVPLSHQNIADMVGLTRETTSLELSKLRREKVITYHGKFYTIERDRLTALIGEDNFKDRV